MVHILVVESNCLFAVDLSCQSAISINYGYKLIALPLSLSLSYPLCNLGVLSSRSYLTTGMFSTCKLAFLLSLGMAMATKAAIGPVATLKIANKNISPDGFTRACVIIVSLFPQSRVFILSGISATVVNGAQSGPLITAKKVWYPRKFLFPPFAENSCQGEMLKLNVVNQLADAKQERGTSIVRIVCKRDVTGL